MWPNHVLMVTPDQFDITYSINPHMLDESNNLKKIDKKLARQQWLNLKNIFSKYLIVEELPGIEEHPDMVFCANPFFPWKKRVILSNMHSEFRRKEVQRMSEWACNKNYEIHTLPESIKFEGMGDLIINYETQTLYGGHGFRTNKQAYTHIEQIIETEITPLQLVSPYFYHLDTCLCIVNKDTALYVPSAFSIESQLKIQKDFKNLFEIPRDEAQQHFAGNACSIDGRTVVLGKNSPMTLEYLRSQSLDVIEVDTSEYIKAGGSVFCMKMLF